MESIHEKIKVVGDWLKKIAISYIETKPSYSILDIKINDQLEKNEIFIIKIYLYHDTKIELPKIVIMIMENRHTKKFMVNFELARPDKELMDFENLLDGIEGIDKETLNSFKTGIQHSSLGDSIGIKVELNTLYEHILNDAESDSFIDAALVLF